MVTDLIVYTFSRSKVERGDFSHFLGLHAPDKLPTGRRLRAMMGSMVLCVDGYDDDPRELHCIPEVRLAKSRLTRHMGIVDAVRLAGLPKSKQEQEKWRNNFVWEDGRAPLLFRDARFKKVVRRSLEEYDIEFLFGWEQWSATESLSFDNPQIYDFGHAET